MHLGLRFNPCKAAPVLSAGELSQISEAAAVRGLKAMGDAGSILSWVPAGQVLLPQHQAAHLCLILAALSLLPKETFKDRQQVLNASNCSPRTTKGLILGLTLKEAAAAFNPFCCLHDPV